MKEKMISRRTFMRAAGVTATAATITGLAPSASACFWPFSMDLQILATSDTHGKFDPWDYAANKADTSGSVAQQAAAIKELRTADTLVIDAGDTIQGNSAQLFLNDDVHPMVAAMNAIGYDIWVPGNHEYNYGLDVTQKVMAQQDAKVLTGNVYAPDGTPLADGYTILKKKDVKIGVIGMVTPNITRWDAVNLAGWTVTNPVDECRRIIDQIQDQVDVLIGVMHMDTENEYGVSGSGVTDLANACPERRPGGGEQECRRHHGGHPPSASAPVGWQLEGGRPQFREHPDQGLRGRSRAGGPAGPLRRACQSGCRDCHRRAAGRQHGPRQ